MIIRARIKPNSYHDSLVLMRISNEMLARPGVIDATAMMGTEQNKHSIGNLALLTPEVQASGPNDLFVVVAAGSEEQAEAALDAAQATLLAGRTRRAIEGGASVRSLEAALRQQPQSNLAILSIPGPYVEREGLRAIEAGLHLFIFSDNVPLAAEIRLKRAAQEQNRLVMGPDCGTAIIAGAALGFANQVRRGAVGLVGASGTGLQEVCCLIDRLGQGVSHAIGTGSHDVDEQVGGATMVQGFKRLEADLATKVLVIISKPPAAAVARRVVAAASTCRKPVVVAFLGGDPETITSQGGIAAETLEDAAVKAVAALTGRPEQAIRDTLLADAGDTPDLVWTARAGLSSTQRYVRGLFSGGTFANEATVVLCQSLAPVYTNGGLNCARRLTDPRVSQGHTCVDLGDDVFTVGKPHPMLEPSLRRERILAEAADPETAVLLLDIVIGHGVHPDPAGVLSPYIAQAKDLARDAGRQLPVVVSVCGVDADPQVRSAQVEAVRKAGGIVMPSNAQAARLAAGIASGPEVC